MSEEKPLHVRVAEAIGCTPKPCDIGHPDLICGCGPSFLVGCHDDPETTHLNHYDVSWQATGPLIEKYCWMMHHYRHSDGDIWMAAGLTEEHGALFGEGAATALLAVCNLILALKEAGKL